MEFSTVTVRRTTKVPFSASCPVPFTSAVWVAVGVEKLRFRGEKAPTNDLSALETSVRHQALNN